MNTLLPHVRDPLTSRGDTTSKPFYTWFQRISELVEVGVASGDSAAAAIRQLALALGSPDGSVDGVPPLANTMRVVGNQSVRVQGSAPNFALLLAGDTTAPPASAFYGTDAAGQRGWQLVASALEAGSGVTLTPDPDTGVVSIAATGIETHNRIDAAGDIRVAADGSLRITT